MGEKNKSIALAVDGPAASGKGSLARRLAKTLDFAYLDTGILYRATGFLVLRQGQDPENIESAAEAAQNVLDIDFQDPILRTEQVGCAASLVASIPVVRQILLQQQRQFAQQPAQGKKGAVLDGRDIGTVVCPDADAKIFVEAALEIRAERRYKELRERGEKSIYQTVLADLRGRDERDKARTVAPLVAADDAFVLDNGNLSITQTTEAALSYLATVPVFQDLLVRRS